MPNSILFLVERHLILSFLLCEQGEGGVFFAFFCVFLLKCDPRTGTETPKKRAPAIGAVGTHSKSVESFALM